jgi:hypothetical protein
MIVTLTLPAINNQLTFDDLPTCLLIALTKECETKTLGEIRDKLEVYIPYANVFKDIVGDWSDMELVLNYLFDPSQPLTFHLYRLLKYFINIEDGFNIVINSDLFDLLNLSKLSTEPVVVPEMVLDILRHRIIGHQAIIDRFKFPLEKYHYLVTNYDKVLYESCHEYSTVMPSRLLHENCDRSDEIIIKTVRKMLKNKITPRQHFINEGKAYMFYGTDFKKCGNVYRDLKCKTDKVFVVKFYGGTFRYNKDELINEIFEPNTFNQLLTLRNLDWNESSVENIVIDKNDSLGG